MNTGVLISIGARLISFIGLALTGRKDTRTDAAQNAIMQTKLDGIINGVDDIRIEVRSMRESINDHGERLARVESQLVTNSHRIEVLEGKNHD